MRAIIYIVLAITILILLLVTDDNSYFAALIGLAILAKLELIDDKIDRGGNVK